MKKLFLSIFIFLFTFSYISYATKDEGKTSIYAGGGYISKPTYEGSSSRRFMWIHMIALRYSDENKTILNEFNFFGPYADLSIFDNKKFNISIFSAMTLGGKMVTITLFKD